MEKFKPKESNLELLRIVNMLLIITHHLAVHTPFVFENIHIKYIVYFLSLGGKIGVNSFVLLTGYLLVDKKLKIKNLFRIWVDVLFYSITIWGFFYFYDKSYIPEIKFFIFPITYYLYWFVTTYFIMYIILYFFNFQLYDVERKRYLKFIIILVILWSVLSSFPYVNLGYSNVLWFILLYLIGGYIKLYVNKIKNKYLYSGKIKVMNVIQNKVPRSILRTLERETIVVLVFDTDIEKIDILDKNIELIKNSNNVRDIIYILQIKNLEDELVYSTKIKKIKDLLESKSDKDFKRDFISCNNLIKKLEEKEFKISKLWSREAKNIYKKYENKSKEIKLQKRD